MGMRYIGSKARLSGELAQLVGPPKDGDGMFVDMFCGTGAVAEAAARLGWDIRLNDHLRCAVVLASARLASNKNARFRAFGGYERAIADLNRLKGQEGFIWREYSPASRRSGARIESRELRFRRSDAAAIERRYFTECNAAKIDAIRSQISGWVDQGVISATEERLLLGDLLCAVNGVANIAGTYGCFLSEWSQNALHLLELVARPLFPRDVYVETSCADATRVKVDQCDLAYLDPPYTKRQYAAYYHVLETIAVGDAPIVEGITGLRPWHEKASDFCYRTRAFEALCHLIKQTRAKRILLSYSSEGHVDLEELRRALEPVGSVVLHHAATIGRYRPNQVASEAASAVTEYVLELEPFARSVRRARSA